MNLTVDDLVDAYAFFARRHGLDEVAQIANPGSEPLAARAQAIAAAITMAEQLSATPDLEPAAILYAFARHPRCFPRALLSFTTVLAQNAAADLGYRIAAADEEFRDVIWRIVARSLAFEDVIGWVAAHRRQR